jgi:hypothetical protein
MPRYFFIVIYGTRTEILERKGTLVRDDATVIKVARKVLNDFRSIRRPEDPGATIVVKNDEDEIIYRFPAN